MARKHYLESDFFQDTTTTLFDLEADPGQTHPISDIVVEERLVDAMVDLMSANDAPSEAYTRLGLDLPE